MTKSPKYKRDLKVYEVTRFQELVIIFEKLYKIKYQGEIINEKTKETLMDIACSLNRYKELLKYYHGKYQEEYIVREKKQKQTKEKSLSELHFEISHKACDLMMSRNEKYGDSWKVLSIQSLANLCEMKLNRIAKLGEVDTKTEDELIDVLNYMVFGLIKLNENKK